jgi:beta-glucosidase
MVEAQHAVVTRDAFPAGFVWGAATAAYQIEGAVHEDGRGVSIWDTFAHTPGKTENGDTGDIACDHYHRYKEDIVLMSQLGLESYRFSVSWPRILPEGRGKVNEKGLDFYEQLVDTLLQHQIQPALTLYHWDLPQTLQDQGGWSARETAYAFAEYADLVSARLGDRVKWWITLNEPWVASILGNLVGVHAPGLHDLPTATRAAHHLLLGHGLAMPILRRNATRPDAECGITLSLVDARPAQTDAHTLEALDLHDAMGNRLFLDPLFKGSYPEVLQSYLAPHLPIEAGDMELIAQPVDFLGVNYYFREIVKDIKNRDSLANWEVEQVRPPDAPITEMGWLIAPDGLYDLLMRLRKEYAPAKIYITENGAAFVDQVEETPNGPRIHDPKRTQYLQAHFDATRQAIEQGVPVSGYFIWSLFDNFEWAYGYSKRFGLVYLDYPTQRRILKDSALWYQQFLS